MLGTANTINYTVGLECPFGNKPTLPDHVKLFYDHDISKTQQITDLILFRRLYGG